MAGGIRWLAIILIGYVIWMAPLHAGEKASSPEGNTAPPAITEDAARLLELGKLFMGQNNPTYTDSTAKYTIESRNMAAEQALNTFRTVVKLYPQYAEGWLWLGIALTETLHYTKEAPQGQHVITENKINEGVQAFRNAYERAPADITYVKYYGDALMVYQYDFDGARKLWERYLPMATTDLQRVTALVQSARASLNKAYFGKAKKMPAAEIRQNFQDAANAVQRAAKLCPKADDVKQMQALLQQYRKILYGK